MLKDPAWDKPKEMRFSASLDGSLNGKAVSVIGSGLLLVERGVVDGEYAIEGLDNNVHPFVFNAVMVTGYPSVCRVAPQTSNPFWPGSYRYDREVRFGALGALSYSAECIVEVDSNGVSFLDSRFQLTGHVQTPELRSCERILETWTPIEPGRLEGTFDISWRTVDGALFTGSAKSQYYLPRGRGLEDVHCRSIKLNNLRHTQNSLALHQESELLIAPGLQN